MKSLWIILLSPVALMFALAGLQTIEWCVNAGQAIPWEAYVLLGLVALWCVGATRIGKEDWKRMNRWFDRLTGEDE